MFHEVSIFDKKISKWQNDLITLWIDFIFCNTVSFIILGCKKYLQMLDFASKHIFESILKYQGLLWIWYIMDKIIYFQT